MEHEAESDGWMASAEGARALRMFHERLGNNRFQHFIANGVAYSGVIILEDISKGGSAIAEACLKKLLSDAETTPPPSTPQRPEFNTAPHAPRGVLQLAMKKVRALMAGMGQEQER